MDSGEILFFIIMFIIFIALIVVFMKLIKKRNGFTNRKETYKQMSY
jgi:uncharacterized membrane protein